MIPTWCFLVLFGAFLAAVAWEVVLRSPVRRESSGRATSQPARAASSFRVEARPDERRVDDMSDDQVSARFVEIVRVEWAGWLP